MSRSPVGLGSIGQGLCRPECVLATVDGSFYISEKGRGVRRIAPDGTQSIAGRSDDAFVPNGIAIGRDGRFVVANIGDAGGVWRLEDDGGWTSLAPELERMSVNFVAPGPNGGLWASISTRRSPRHLAYRADVADGFIVAVEDGFKIIVDGLAYTNEFRVSPDGAWLYVSETMGFRVTRRAILRDGLGAPETVVTLPAGWFADGIAFDVEGGLWVACIVANALLRVAPDGAVAIIVQETDETWLTEVNNAFVANTMGRVHFDTTPGVVLRNITSIAFCGVDLGTIVLGSLAGDTLPTLPAPLAGIAPPHWSVQPVLTAFSTA
jgi:sugar lactone lactonase YvrE